MSLSNTSVSSVMQALKDITANTTQCFTAYDITKAARGLTADNIRHSDVRELLHAFYDQGFLQDYDRIPHSFWQNGRQEQAQLFCPPDGDADNYNPDDVQMVKTQPTGAPQDQDDSEDTEPASSQFNGMIGITGMQVAPPASRDGMQGSTSIVGSWGPRTQNNKPISAASPDDATTSSEDTVPSKGLDPFALLDKIKGKLKKLPKLW